MWRRLWAAIRAAVFGKGGRRGARAATAPVEVAPTPAPETASVPQPEPEAARELAPEPVEVAPTPETASASQPEPEAPLERAPEPVEVALTPAPKSAPAPQPEPEAPRACAPELVEVAPVPAPEPAAAADPWFDLALLRALAPDSELVPDSAPEPGVDALPEARFWALIGAAAEARADGSEAQAEALRAALQALSAEELVAFEAALAVQMARANRWALWGAAAVALGGAPDDGFAYARLWLIGQGREVFERVLADPDALADVLPEDVEAALEFESLMYVAGDVWCEKTGREAEEWPGAGVDGGDEPAGEPVEEDEDVLAKRYPKLWKRFAEAALG